MTLLIWSNPGAELNFILFTVKFNLVNVKRVSSSLFTVGLLISSSNSELSESQRTSRQERVW